MAGKFVVIIGPSASGKTAIVKKLLEEVPSSTRLVTTTTRALREGEKNGKDYFFVNRTKFEEGIEKGEFFEYADVYGNWYGSSKRVLDESLAKYDFVFAVIDVQGAQTLKSKVKNVTTIFIRPSSMEEVRKKISKERVGVSEMEIKKRLETVEKELSLAGTFDAVVDNKDGFLDETVKNIIKIVCH